MKCQNPFDNLFLPLKEIAREYFFKQPLAHQDILFAEQKAIFNIPLLLAELPIPSPPRTVIYTDSQITFTSAYTKPPAPAYPTLLRGITKQLTHTTILVKVRAHHDSDPIPGNYIADQLAGWASDYSKTNLNSFCTPSRLNFSKLVHGNHACRERTTLWDSIEPD